MQLTKKNEEMVHANNALKKGSIALAIVANTMEKKKNKKNLIIDNTYLIL